MHPVIGLADVAAVLEATLDPRVNAVRFSALAFLEIAVFYKFW